MVHNIGFPALPDEVLGPAFAPVRRRDKARPCRAPSVYQNDRNLVSRFFGKEILDVHGSWLGPGKEIAFRKRHGFFVCGMGSECTQRDGNQNGGADLQRDSQFFPPHREGPFTEDLGGELVRVQPIRQSFEAKELGLGANVAQSDGPDVLRFWLLLYCWTCFELSRRPALDAPNAGRQLRYGITDRKSV